MAKRDEAAWRPTPEYVKQSTLLAFLRKHELDDCDHLVRRSNEDPEWYWNTIIQDFSIRFY